MKLYLRILGVVMLVFGLAMTTRTLAAYSVETVPASSFDATGTAVSWSNNTSLTNYPIDDDFQLVNIGFTFYLGETGYTQVRILSNGGLHFGADQGFYKDYTNEALPIEEACTGNCPGFEEPADRVILGYWDDLEPSSGGTVTYDTLGSGSNRRFVATWNGIRHYNASGTYSVQIVLYETGEVLFRYGNDNATGASATIGIEVDNGDYTQYSYNSNSVSDSQDLYWVREFPSLSSVSASCSDTNTVTVQFASAVQASRATNPGNFSISNGVTVTGAALVDSTTVQLTTSSLAAGVDYTLFTTYPNQSMNFSLSSGAASGSFADDFNTDSYSNNTGTLNWAGSWQEQNDGSGSGGGDIQIDSNRLRFDDDGDDQPGIYRELDLSAYTSATLTYNYETLGSLEGSDEFMVQVSSNGGSSYTTVASYQNDVSGSASIDITAYISSNTRIRFGISDGYRGDGEFMTIDDVTVNVSGAGTACPSQVVGIWRMESGPWSGASGEVLDLSGNGLDGVAMNSAQSLDTSPARAGDPGTCAYAELNGSNQFIEVADNDLLDLDSELTVAVWIYPNALPGGDLMSILSKDENYEFHLKPDGEVNWWWNDTGGATRQFDSSGANITPGSWYHIAITYQSGSQKIYVNGVELGSASYTGTPRTNADPLHIGQDQYYAGRYFNGRIDEVQIYSSALSSAEIQDLYTETHSCGVASGSCGASFPDALSSHSSGTITFAYDDQITNSPDGILDAGAVINSGGRNTCNTVNCSASGSSVPQLDAGAFPNTGGATTDFNVGFRGTGTLGTDRNQYRNVTVSNEGVLTVSNNYNEYFIHSLTLNYRSQINLVPGDYWINSLSVDNEVVINVVGSGTARLFVNNNVSFNFHSRTNSPALGASGDVSKLLLYAYGDVDLDQVTFSGVVYSQGDVSLDYSMQMFGAITADDINMNGAADISYDADGVTNLDFGDLCDGSACTLGGFAITQPSYAIACSDTRAQINIQAMCDDGTTAFDSFAGTLDLMTNENSLSEFYLTDTGGSPITTLVFDGSENGERDVYLYHQNENNDLRVTVTDQASGIIGTAGVGTDVRSYGLKVEGGSTFICGNSINLTLTAIGVDSETGACAVLTDFDGSKDFKAWYEVNLDADIATQETSPTSMAIGGTNVGSQSTPATNNLSLNFTNGIATASVGYLDAGQIKGVYFLHDDPPYDGTVPELDQGLLGNSETFVVKPDEVAMAVVTANADCASQDKTCTAFVAAGAPFEVQLSAQCSDDTVALSYQGTVDLAHSLVAPDPLSSPPPSQGYLGVDQANILVNGSVGITNQTIDEVGVFDLTATPQNYYGETVSGSMVTNVGRFYAAYLDIEVNGPVFTPPWTCGFTYQDQSFGYATAPVLTVTGHNHFGAVTNNYDGDFFNFSDPEMGYINNLAGSIDSVLGYDSSARSYNTSVGTAFDGSRSIEISGDLLTHQKSNMTPNATDAPFDVDVGITFSVAALTDNDGACFRPSPIESCESISVSSVTGTQIRYGRLRIENAFGPETTNLRIPMLAQHWDGDSFELNTSDDCTAYQTDGPWLTLDNYSDGLGAGETQAEVGGSTGMTESFVGGAYDMPNNKDLYLTAPGLNNQGGADVNAAVEPWLEYDWDGNGTLDDPKARATFGQYRGHDRIIFWREVTN